MLWEPLAGGLVELCGEFVGWNAVSVEALAASENFAAEARVLVDLQHVDAEVGEADARCDFERVLPTGSGLIRRPAMRSAPTSVTPAACRRRISLDAVALGMGAANGGALAIDKGLHAEADAIDTLVLGFGEESVGNLAGCGFKGDFCVGRDLEGLAKRGEDAAKLRGVQADWGFLRRSRACRRCGEDVRGGAAAVRGRRRSPGRVW